MLNTDLRLFIEDGVFYLEYISDINFDKDVALKSVEVVNGFLEGNLATDIPIVVKSDNFNPIFTLAGRQILSSKEATKYFSCAAIVAKNSFQKLIGNLYITISKPNMPTKLFSNEADALTWVDKQLQVIGKTY